MECPVCTRQAANRTPETLRHLVVECDDCGQYRIADAAYFDFSRMPAAARANALRTAKGSTRFGLPMIDLRALDSTRHASG